MRTNGKSIQVWVVQISAQKNGRWRSVLNPAECERAARFRMPEDQDRFNVTRGVLRTLLSGYLHLPAAGIEFTANENGKPAVLEAGIRFNVSHSGDYALLAFAEDADVGVDVERLRGGRVVGDLARRVLSPSEFERFAALAERDREKAFFQIWTLKESVLKAMGSGLSVAPESIEVAFYPDEPKLLSSNVGEWTVRSLSIGDDGYAAAVAVKGNSPVIELKHFE
jgi:4'-phosphopantetheinyl transferase